MKSLEYCCECEQPTGRAGQGEDSLYDDITGEGPYCEQCFEEIEQERELEDRFQENRHQQAEWDRLSDTERAARIRNAVI